MIYIYTMFVDFLPVGAVISIPFFKQEWILGGYWLLDCQPPIENVVCSMDL